MSSVDPDNLIPSPPPTAPRDNRPWWQWLARRVCTQNPFYLLSVAFVLHSTKLWYQPSDGPYEPWPLMAIISGYVILVAVTGLVLVRLWNVWDDVRSILLMLLLLFSELSFTFDTLLVSRPATGRALLLIGLALSVAISEGLFFGLKIRLPRLYRLPYHALLTLLFLSPLAVVAGARHSVPLGRWLIFGYWPVAACLVLTLLPAVRRGPEYIRGNGTPWAWPWYPWSLFVCLIGCIGLRGYTLGESFDPAISQAYAAAMQLDTIFGTYFLVPLLLAGSALLLEAGLVAKSTRLQQLALASAAVGIVLAFPGAAQSSLQAEFLAQFQAWLGSPVRMALYFICGFFAYAWWRQVRHAEGTFLATLALAAFAGPDTLSFTRLSGCQPAPLWLIAAVQFIQGLMTRTSRPWTIAALCGLGALRLHIPAELSWLYRDAIPLHLAMLSVLLIAAAFRDRFAQSLKLLGIALLVTATLSGAMLAEGPHTASSRVICSYLCGMVVVSLAYAYLLRSPWYFFAGVLNGLIAGVRLLFEFAIELELVLSWKGAGYFVVGLCWFALAVLVSAVKAGVLRRLMVLIPRRHEGVARHPL